MEKIKKPIEFEASKSLIQFIKFGLVGVLNTLVDFLIYSVLVLIFGISEGQVFLIGLFTLIAYACGVLNSFLLNTRWTFKKEYNKTHSEVLKFIIVNLISWGLSFFLVWLLSHHMFNNSSITQWVCNLIDYTSPEQVDKMTSILSKLCSAPFVIIVNFLGSKLFVFNKKR